MGRSIELSLPMDISDRENIISLGRASSAKDSPSRFLQLLAQNQGSGGTWTCQNLDIVDACRGTSVSETYRGNFQVYTGPCEGDFVSGLPIYISTDRPNEPLYIYPLDIYPDNWSVAELRGLVRWRIVSFKTFDDKKSCRVENANVYYIEFASDGQPYNYFPTIYCFDENGNEFSGYKSSTINIRCNDPAPGSGGGSGSDGGGGNAGLAIGIIAVLLLLGAAAFFWWKRRRDRRERGDLGDYGQSIIKDHSNEGDQDIYSIDDVERAGPIDGPSEHRPIDGPSEHRPNLLDRIKSFAPPRHNEDASFIDEDKRRLAKNRRAPTDGEAQEDAIAAASNTSASTAETQKTYDGEPDGILYHDEVESESSNRGGSDQQPDIFELEADGLPDLYNLESGRFVAESVPDSEPDIREIPQRHLPVPGSLPRTPSKVEPPAKVIRNSFIPQDITDMAASIDQDLRDLEKNDGFNPTMRDAPARKNDSHHKDPDMDLSQRSRFKNIRSRWSDRSRALGRDSSNDETRRSQVSPSGKIDPDRSRSMERWKAANHADRTRSRSRERSGASDHGEIRRSGSKERSGASGFEDSRHKKRGRSTSLDRSKASNHAKGSRSRSNGGKNPSDHANRARPRSKERSNANDYVGRSRSRSHERSNADGYSRSRPSSDTDEIVLTPRSRSQERSGANDHANRNGSQSKERSAARSDAYGGRSQSKDRSNRGVDDKRSRSHSAERSGANNYDKNKKIHNNRSVSDHQPRTRHPSGHEKTMDFGAGSDKKGRGSLDASKAGTTITKNSDGTVVVAKKRTREDGAVVTTKTKYANVALARSHGVEV